METELFKKDNLIVLYASTKQGLNLIVKKFNGYQVEQVYEGRVPSIQSETYLSHFFENTEELIDHMKIDQNIQINTQSMTAKVVSWVNTKKIKKIQILQVNLHLIVSFTKNKISQIIKFCSNQAQINNNFLKKSIKVIAEGLYSIMNQKQNIIKIQEIEDIRLKQNNLRQKFKQFRNQMYSLVYQKPSSSVKKQPLIQEPLYLQLNDKVKQLQKRYQIQYSKIIEQIKQLADKVSEQLNEKVEQLSKNFVTFQETQAIINKMRKLGQDFQKMQDGTNKKDKIDKKDNKPTNERHEIPNFKSQQPYLSKFKVTGNIIEYIGENKTNTHYLFNKPIQYKQEYSFKIKILKAGKSPYYIYIGIADYQNEKNQRYSSYKTSFFYCRNSLGKGFKYPTCIEEGNGFGQGDIVQVDINLSAKIIKWIVNGKLQASETNDKLGVKKTTFMPFVQFYYTNSTVQWIDD